jgi:hypothetical protein
MGITVALVGGLLMLILGRRVKRLAAREAAETDAEAEADGVG